MTRQLPATLAAAALVLAGTVGCAQIPDSGPVHPGLPVEVPQDPALVYLQPVGPQQGDSPQQVVEGFLAAMQAYPPTFLVARQFLATDAAARWEPEVGTTIYAEPVTDGIANRRVRLEATRLGSLSERGSWTTATPADRSFSRTFRMELVHGEWRIANPPAGILVPQAHFERYYRQYALYFFNPTRDILVPDPIYLPDSRQTPTLLVQGLLRGPTPWLEGAVETLVPASTQVDLAVAVSSFGQADVPLSDEVRALPEEERKLLLAQLVWTLRQAPSVLTVNVTVGGTSLDIPGSLGVVAVDALPGFDPAAGVVASRELYGLRGNRLVTVDGPQARPVAGPLGAGELPAAVPAVDVKGQRAAVVSDQRRRVYVCGITLAASGAPTTPVRWYTGARILRPSWDGSGRLWIVDDTERGARVLVAGGAGRPAEVMVPGVTGRDVQALRVSRDGVRLAAVVGRDQQAKLLLARVDRAADGQIRAVSHVRVVRTPLVRFRDIVDIAWSSPTSLAVLARSGRQAAPQPYIVAIDGSSVAESTPLPDSGATVVAAAPNPDLPLVVATAGRRLWVREVDLRWTRLGGTSRIRSPVYPG